MARTLNDNLTGRAASIDRQDQLTNFINQPSEFMKKFMKAVNILSEIDPDFETWYDGRPEQTKGEMLPLMLARIEEINLRTK